MNEINNDPRLFVTDYASYNDGSQFEFGKWWNLTDYADADEFSAAISKHFKAADKKRPIPYTIREETMFTDFENFPDQLYSESCNSDDLQAIFDWIDLDDDDKAKVEYLLEQGHTIVEALDSYDDVTLFSEDKYNLYEMFYPEAHEAVDKFAYLVVDYDSFIRECFHEFTDSNGNSYLVSID